MATHFITSVDLRIGDVDVPAGTYTLWMLPSETGDSFLIINSQTRIFGTNYNPSRDFARIPLRRHEIRQTIERLTFAVADGQLWIYWGDTGWSIAVREKAD